MSRLVRPVRVLLATGGLLAGAACGDRPEAARPAGSEAVAAERTEFSNWLERAPSSPFRAIVQYPLAGSATLGPPGSDIPLAGVAAARVEESSGRLRLTFNGVERPLARERLTAIGDYQLLPGGPAGRTVLTVFGREPRGFHPASYYPYLEAWRFVVTLEREGAGDPTRLLGPEGVETEGNEAGRVRFAIGSDSIALRVFRLRTPGTEESDLKVYFQDSTNGHGTYPAGRFVSLLPESGDRYVLDFNRARNPFCAYSAVYPCPAPWRGNRVPAAVEAGERYDGGGLESPPSGP